MATRSATRSVYATYSALYSGQSAGFPVTSSGLDSASTYAIDLNDLSSSRVFGCESAENRARSVAVRIDAIRSNLNLGMAGIASLLGVSRQAIYKWLSGVSVPESERKANLILLESLANQCANSGLKKPERTLDVQIDGGETLRSHFVSHTATESLLERAIGEVLDRQREYALSGIADSASPVTDTWREHESISGNGE